MREKPRAPLTSTGADRRCVLCLAACLCVSGSRCTQGSQVRMSKQCASAHSTKCTRGKASPLTADSALMRALSESVRVIPAKKARPVCSSVPLKSSPHVCCCFQLPTCCWRSVSSDGYHSWRCPSLSGRDPLLPPNYHPSDAGKRKSEGGRKGTEQQGTEGRFGWVPPRCLIVFIDDRPTCSLDTHFPAKTCHA